MSDNVEMIDEMSGMMMMMMSWSMGIGGLLVIVVLILAVASLIKYLCGGKNDSNK